MIFKNSSKNQENRQILIADISNSCELFKKNDI